MRNYLYLIIFTISLIGCLTTWKIISLQKQIQEIRTDMIKLIDAEDQYEMVAQERFERLENSDPIKLKKAAKSK